MKSNRILLIFLSLLYMQLSAQVFTRADFAYAKQWYTYQTDTNPSTKIKVRYTGTSNTWNFSTGLKNHIIDTISFEDTTNYPNKPSGCNLVQVSNANFNYLKVDSDGVKAFLNFGNFTDTTNAIKNLITQYPFPLAYSTEARDSLYTTRVQSVTELGLDNPLYDSLKTDVKVLFHTLVDASGQLTTPKGIYEQTLRVRSTQQPFYSFYGRNKTTNIFEPLNIPIPGGINLVNTDTTYTWWVYKKGHYVAQAIVNGRLLRLSYLSNSSRGAVSVPNLDNKQFTLYPNPSRGSLHIEKGNFSFEKYSIINSIGQKVKEGSFISNLDLSDLSDGLYFLSLITSNNETFTKQFVRTR